MRDCHHVSSEDDALLYVLFGYWTALSSTTCTPSCVYEAELWHHDSNITWEEYTVDGG